MQLTPSTVLDGLSRRLFLALAGSRRLKEVASRYGMRGPGGAARRFIGGRNVNEAIDAARRLEERGLLHTFNYLGEHVRTQEAAEAATIAYLWVIESVGLAGMDCNLSVKLTQLGLELDTGLCRDNLKRILTQSDARRCFVRVDMEGSPLVDRTLDVVEAMHEGRAPAPGRGAAVGTPPGRRTTSPASPSFACRCRLVKGAYKEPPDGGVPGQAGRRPRVRATGGDPARHRRSSRRSPPTTRG